ncbi:hypothetical protein [Fontivita pretiosa]|uniref:hypothetical protein n=1 Tax=Fontivita pretiosa TaxID=2989684 RepID=UPI003D17E976
MGTEPIIAGMPHALDYDTLPPHSRLRREFSDGVLTIIAAAEEPGPLVRRTALHRSAVFAAILFLITLLVGLLVFGAVFQAHRRLMSQTTMLTLGVAALVFCVALFALIWRLQYLSRLDAAARALRQNTVLAASAGRLLIETSGPFGSAGYDLRNQEGQQAVRALRLGRCGGDRPVDCLEILLGEGTRIHILPGRDSAELRWVAAAIARAIRNPAS